MEWTGRTDTERTGRAGWDTVAIGMSRKQFAGTLAACCIAGLAGCIPAGQVRPTDQSTGSSKPYSLPAPASPLSNLGTAPGGEACIDRLWKSGSNFISAENRSTAQGCTLVNAVSLESFGGDHGAIKVSNLSAISCSTASAMAGWVRYGVDRAARQMLGSGVAQVETFGSYNCRSVAGKQALSAHSTGQAIDVSGFVLADGRTISIKHAWTRGSDAERQFLRTVRESACRRFNTVLSPDYDTAHQDHFHLETGPGSTCR